MAKLGDICTIYSGTGFPVQYQGTAEGQYPFYKVGDIAKNVTIGNKYLVFCENYVEADIVKIIKGTILPSRTVVFAKIGEAVKLNRRAITSCECLIDNNAMGIAPNESVLTLDYFFHYMCSLRLETLAEATTVPSVKKSLIEKLDIPLPSLLEQEKISTMLNKVSELITLRREQLAKLDQLVKSRFIELFGDPETNPKGLEKVLLSDMAEYFNGLTYSPDNVTNDGTIVLRSSNIQNSQLDFADTVRVNSSIKDKLFVKDNDILMCSRNGSARLVGKVALIKNLSEPMTFGAFMMIIRSRYYPYLMTYFQMDAFRRQIATGATTTINQITGNMLNKISLPLPDMADINEFVTFVEQTDKSKLAIQQSLDKLELLKKSLMQEYFG